MTIRGSRYNTRFAFTRLRAALNCNCAAATAPVDLYRRLLAGDAGSQENLKGQLPPTSATSRRQAGAANRYAKQAVSGRPREIEPQQPTNNFSRAALQKRPMTCKSHIQSNPHQ